MSGRAVLYGLLCAAYSGAFSSSGGDFRATRFSPAPLCSSAAPALAHDRAPPRVAPSPAVTISVRPLEERDFGELALLRLSGGEPPGPPRGALDPDLVESVMRPLLTERTTRAFVATEVRGGGGEHVVGAIECYALAPVAALAVDSPYGGVAATSPPKPAFGIAEAAVPARVYLKNLVVLPRLRRCGVGRALLLSAEAQACAWGLDTIALEVSCSCPDRSARSQMHAACGPDLVRLSRNASIIKPPAAFPVPPVCRKMRIANAPFVRQPGPPCSRCMQRAAFCGACWAWPEFLRVSGAARATV